MKRVFNFIALILLTQLAFAQNSVNRLTILNPANGLWTDGVPAYFESINVDVQPQDGFANVDIELELSGQYTQYAKSTIALEFVYRFELPAGSIIHDAWLWMEGVPVQARLYERGEAKVIYESFVVRRTDPLIIYKDGDTYEARIYPVVNPNARKIKLSILIPAQINSNQITLPLPLEMFHQELTTAPTNEINVMVDESTDWGKPSMSSKYQTTSDGNTFTFKVPHLDVEMAGNSELIFENSTVENLFTTYTNPLSGERFFQMIVKDEPPMKEPGKYLFILDYATQGEDMYILQTWSNMLKNKIMLSFSEKDSFNILFTSNKNIRMFKDEWIGGSKSNVETVLKSLPIVINNNENPEFEDLISVGIKFINDHGKDAGIYLMSTTLPPYRTNVEADEAFNDLKGQMEGQYSCHIMDMNALVKKSWTVNGERKLNNQYLLEKLAAIANGSYARRLKSFIHTDRWGDWEEFKSVAASKVVNECFDNLQQRREFTHFTYDWGASFLFSEQIVHDGFYQGPIGQSLMVTGQIWGNASDSLKVDFYSGIDGQVIKKSYAIEPKPGTIYTERAWAGSYLNVLQHSAKTQAQRNYVVNKSIEHNVMTDFTAFLALEPDTMVFPVTGGEPFVGLESALVEENFSMKAYPNPFSHSLFVKMNVGNDLHGQNWSVCLTDLMGRTISCQTGIVGNSNKLVVPVVSDGHDLQAGMYLVSVKIGSFKSTLKVLRAN